MWQQLQTITGKEYVREILSISSLTFGSVGSIGQCVLLLFLTQFLSLMPDTCDPYVPTYFSLPA
jgi:hypothetical protein